MPIPAELGDAVALLKRFDKAKGKRDGSWWSLMQECYSYSAPQRESFFEYTPGQEKNTEIYDDTAVVGLQLFASRMQQSVIPSWQQFAKLEPGSDITDDEASGSVTYGGEELTMAEALERVTDTAFSYLNRSNFSSKAYEALIDFGISTGVLTCDFDAVADELVFDAMPLPSAYLESGPRGTVETVWRETEIEVRLVKQLWPAATIPDKLAEKIDKQPDKKAKFVEGFVFNPMDRVTYYVVISKTDKAIIFDQADDISPVIAFRGMVVPGEVYGRGPIMQVLPTIKTLNLVKEYELISGAIAASGVWTGIDDGAFNPYTVQIAPGVVIPVSSNETANPTLRALDMNFDFQFTQIKADELQASINRVLFANPIGDIDDPTKTATEIMIRRQMDLQEQSAFFSRVQTELVDKLMRRVIYVLQREGKVPQLKIDGKEVAIKHTSPIAKAMDLEDVQNVMQAAGMAQQVAGPEMAILGMKMEEIPGFIAEKLGVDPSLRRTKAEAQQLQQQAAQLLAQMQAPQEGPPEGPPDA